MDAATLVKLVIVLGIVLIVVSIGARTRFSSALFMLREPATGLRAMAAMYLLVPLFALLVMWLAPVQQAVRVTILALAVSPMVPLIQRKQEKLGGDEEYNTGLQVLATIVSIFVVPAMIWVAEAVFKVPAFYEPMALANVLLVTVGVPLIIGMSISQFMPAIAPAVSLWSGRLGNGALGIGVLVLLNAIWPHISGIIGEGAIISMIALIFFALASGHALGGPVARNRSSLAVANAGRHPGAAIVLCSAIFPEQSNEILAAAVLYLLVYLVLGIPYGKWMKSRATAA